MSEPVFTCTACGRPFHPSRSAYRRDDCVRKDEARGQRQLADRSARDEGPHSIWDTDDDNLDRR
jgi:hypothetical protein